ncbi:MULTISPECIES: M28 family metallopeptidase [unclassified Myroides]|uniref:M28 family metallopeptidase n=1 Tax=unclassified Myroides TaxID=2642485 RepID=UPI003D2F801C
MKKYIPLPALFLIALAFVQCHSPQAVVQHDPIATKEAYFNRISRDSIQKSLLVLTADSLEGRRTGEPGQRKAAHYLASYYKRLGIGTPPNTSSYFQPVPASFMTNWQMKLKDSENVWAFIEGSEKPEEVLVISAHFDHMGILLNKVYYGADDNGSGTSAVMEIARVFQSLVKEGIRPKRSVLFLHVTGEEFGLFGSKYYTQNPPIPLSQTIANLNIDMIGRRSEEHPSTQDYIFLVGSDKLSQDLHDTAEKANTESVQLVLDYTFNDDDDPQQIYYRSDHYSFAKNNIPAIFFYNGTHEDYHLPSDTFDKIDFPILTKRTQLIFETAWKLANGDHRPRLN